MTDIPAPYVSMRHALSAAFHYAFSRFEYIVRISWPFFLLMLAPVALQYVYGPIPSFQFKTAEEIRNNLGLISTVSALTLVYFILFMLMGTAYFILFARDYFLSERPSRFRHVFWATLWRYIVVGLLSLLVWIGLIICVAAIGGIAALINKTVGGVIAFALAAAAFVAVIYIFNRWITWPVAYAVDRPQTLGETWRSSAKAAWKIFAGYIVLFICFLIVALIIIAVATLVFGFSMFPRGFPPRPPVAPEQPGLVTQLVLAIVNTVLSQIVMAICAVFITDIFKQIRSAR